MPFVARAIQAQFREIYALGRSEAFDDSVFGLANSREMLSDVYG